MSITKQIDQEVIEKPWGKEIVWARSKDYMGKIIIINKGCRLSLQYHNEKTETILLLSGELLIEGKDGVELAKLSSGDAFHILPEIVHRFCATTQQVTIVEVSTNHMSDVVRIEDDYGR